jgi:hypothetical protein
MTSKITHICEEDCQVRLPFLSCDRHIFDPEILSSVIAAHTIYGVPQTINAANYVYFLVYQDLFSLQSHPNLPMDDTKPGVIRRLFDMITDSAPVQDLVPRKLVDSTRRNDVIHIVTSAFTWSASNA